MYLLFLYHWDVLMSEIGIINAGFLEALQYFFQCITYGNQQKGGYSPPTPIYARVVIRMFFNL